MQFKEGFVDSLYYNVLDMTPEWVEQPATIIFHHGVGANTEIWAEWLPVLGLNYRIARFDMRGFGQYGGCSTVSFGGRVNRRHCCAGILAAAS